jgi:hypothetical protein
MLINITAYLCVLMLNNLKILDHTSLKLEITILLALLLISPDCWAFCETAIAERDPLPDSSWILVTKIYRCAAIGDGTTTIVAVDQNTKREEEILFVDEITDSSIEIGPPETINITLPNFVDLVRKKASFEGMTINYKFIPKDDPEERREYQFWLHNPNDPHAIEWSKKNFALGR